MKYVNLIKSSFELDCGINYDFLGIKVKAPRVVRLNNISKSYFNFMIYMLLLFFLKKIKFETPPKLKLNFWIYHQLIMNF